MSGLLTPRLHGFDARSARYEVRQPRGTAWLADAADGRAARMPSPACV